MNQFGNYRLIRPLGQKGHGDAWVAEQIDLRRKVVLNLFDPPSPRELQQYHRVARSLGTFEDQRIARIHEFGQHQGLFFFATEWISGQSLRGLLHNGGMGPKSTASFLAEVSEALERVHQNGIIHRNLNPTNLFRDDHGVVRIADFGLSRSWDNQSLTRHSEKFGVSAYLAPEQVSGSFTDHRADIFAVGKILEEMIQGQPNRGLATIARKATAPQPADRYLKALDLAKDLRNFIDGKPLLAHKRHLARKGLAMMRRYPVAAAALALLGITLVWDASQQEQVKADFGALNMYVDSAAEILKLNQAHPGTGTAMVELFDGLRESVNR